MIAWVPGDLLPRHLRRIIGPGDRGSGKGAGSIHDLLPEEAPLPVGRVLRDEPQHGLDGHIAGAGDPWRLELRIGDRDVGIDP